MAGNGRRLVTLIALLLIGLVLCLPRRLSAQPPAVDSLGDSLPAAAKLRLGTLRFHPPSGVNELALSPDESVVVTVGNELIAWDTATGKELWRAAVDEFGREAQGSRYGARPIAFAAEGTDFYTTNGPNQIAIWNSATGDRELLPLQTEINANQMRAKTLALDVAPDGQTFALGRVDGVVVCDREGELLYEFANNDNKPVNFDGNDRLAFFGAYSYACFSPDGKTLAVVTSEYPETIRLHDAYNGEELMTLELTDKLVRLSFSPDGKRIVVTERDSAVRMYDAESGQRIWSHVVPLKNPFENYTSAVAYSPDGKLVAAGATDHRIYLLDSATGKEAGRLTGTHWYPWTLAFTKDGERLYSAGWDGTIRRWNVATREQLPLPQGVHGSEVVAASPDGKTLAYQDDAGTIRLVASVNGAELRRLAVPGLRSSQLQFSPDGRFLAAGGSQENDVQVVLWNVATGEESRRWTWPKGRDPHSHVESLSFTPDGARLAAAVFRQSAAYLWDLTDGQQIAQLKHPEIYGLSFSPDGETLATAGWDKVIRFWNAETGNNRSQHVVQENGDDNRMYAVCYSPEGNLLATAHLDGFVRIWQGDELELQSQFQVPGRFVYGAMSFSPDGLWLATGASSGAVELWDPLAGAKVWDQGKHSHYVYTVGFGRDSRTLVTGSDDGLCYLWDLRPAEGLANSDTPQSLWNDLAGDDSAAAYRVMWTLTDSPDQAVEMMAEQLRDAKVLDAEQAVAVRRALEVLVWVGTPAAKQLLKDLSQRDPQGELGQFATSALRRMQVSE